MGFDAFSDDGEQTAGNPCPICGSEAIREPVNKGLNRVHYKCTSCDWGYIDGGT